MNLFIPIFTVLILTAAVIKKVDIVSAFKEGVFEGLETLKNIFPVLLLILTAVKLLRASGFIEFFALQIGKICSIPPEIIPLALFKPISGSGALAVASDIIEKNGADSYIGRAAAILSASSETTLYVLTLYTAGSKQKYGKVLCCALLCDLAATLFSLFFSRILY